MSNFIVPIFIGCMFIFTFGMILSPTLRSKFMGHQLKMQKKILILSRRLREKSYIVL